MEKISENLNALKSSLPGHVTLVAVSKTHPSGSVKIAWDSGQKDFGENKVQELLSKKDDLPSDIRWHLIGHLQTNKVKFIAPFIYMIHSVDSLKLLKEINKQAVKAGRIIDCLLQVHIASEETKFGLNSSEVFALLESAEYEELKNVKIRGLMGMATNTEDASIVRSEFSGLKKLFDQLRDKYGFDVLSMGMTSDYEMAVEEGSNMIRVGSAIFGSRDYSK